MPNSSGIPTNHLLRQLGGPSFLMGALCAVVGLLTGCGVWWFDTSRSFDVLPLAAAGAGLCSGLTVGWLALGRRLRSGLVGGAIAGMLAAVIGHWLCCYFMMLLGFPYDRLGTMLTSSMPLSPIEGATTLTAVSLVVVGWFTIPAGAMIGALLSMPSAAARLAYHPERQLR